MGLRAAAARVAIWLGLRRSPLRRTIDRIEIAARWLAITIALASLTLAPLAAHTASNALSSANDTDTAEVALLARTQTGTPTSGEWARAAPAAHQGESSTRAANTDGPRVTGPHATAVATALQAGTGLLVVLLGVGAAGGLVAVTGRLLQRSKERYWEHAWRSFNHDPVVPGP